MSKKANDTFVIEYRVRNSGAPFVKYEAHIGDSESAVERVNWLNEHQPLYQFQLKPKKTKGN